MQEYLHHLCSNLKTSAADLYQAAAKRGKCDSSQSTTLGTARALSQNRETAEDTSGAQHSEDLDYQCCSYMERYYKAGKLISQNSSSQSDRSQIDPNELLSSLLFVPRYSDSQGFLHTQGSGLSSDNGVDRLRLPLLEADGVGGATKESGDNSTTPFSTTSVFSRSGAK